MNIKSFEFIDATSGWMLEKVSFSGFNLLVGVSGAGKTRIVRALEHVFNLAIGAKDGEETRGARFAIEFDHDGLEYRWNAVLEPPLPPTENIDNGSKLTVDSPLIHTEQITQAEQVIVNRSPDRFEFMGQEIPRIDRSKSAIAVLKDNPSIRPLHRAFSACVSKMLALMPTHGMNFEEFFEKEKGMYQSVEDIAADQTLPIHHKAEILQELFPEAFTEIEDIFRDAFPTVEQLRVWRSEPRQVSATFRSYHVALQAKEAGVDVWVPFHGMSSGMQRYLSFLIHLAFAPRGTVVLIDELEASLGINCLPAATRFLLNRAPDLQFIITSHHPYIIEKIPMDRWKIVTRKGSHVRVLDAAAIPALQERSRLDHFTRLINLPEYEQGIAL
jgi:hypothetical protein